VEKREELNQTGFRQRENSSRNSGIGREQFRDRKGTVQG